MKEKFKNKHAWSLLSPLLLALTPVAWADAGPDAVDSAETVDPISRIYAITQKPFNYKNPPCIQMAIDAKQLIMDTGHISEEEANDNITGKVDHIKAQAEQAKNNESAIQELAGILTKEGYACNDQGLHSSEATGVCYFSAKNNGVKYYSTSSLAETADDLESVHVAFQSNQFSPGGDSVFTKMGSSVAIDPNLENLLSDRKELNDSPVIRTKLALQDAKKSHSLASHNPSVKAAKSERARISLMDTNSLFQKEQ